MHLLILLSLAACADTTAPSWPAGAVLEAEPAATQIRVSWPDPVDDDVLVFVVSVDGEERTRATTSTHTITAGDLEDETAYALEVTAVDDDGNVSAPLAIRVETLDGTPPQWPEDAELVATSSTPPGAGERTVDLAWPAAIDATVYRVSREAVTAGRVESRSHRLDAAPLTAETTFEVRAIDEAGNESEPLTVVWGETDQASREAGGETADEDRPRRPDQLIMTISGTTGVGTISDLLSGLGGEEAEGLSAD